MRNASLSLVLLAGVVLGVAQGAEKAPPPNIILIVVDDVGYADLGCYGQKKIQTPQLDHMAAEGMRFTQAYSGCTVCAPSRCCLLTGLHTGHATIRGNPQGGPDYPLTPSDVTVSKLLRGAGYATSIFGKWGLGDQGSTGLPHLQGFDEFVGYLNHYQAHDQFPIKLFSNQGEVAYPENRDDKLGTYSNDVFTTEALRFIRQHQEKPFFLYLPYTAGHFEYVLPSPAPYGEKDWPKKEKFYAAMLTRMDADVGKILATLQEVKLDDRTLVLFTSDNGPTSEGGHNANFFESSGPLRGKKRDLYEGGIRVPFMARWPGHIKRGVVSDAVVASWDVLPTAAEIAGATPPANLDGVSLLPVLEGKGLVKRDHLYWEFHEGRQTKQALRFGDWKAVRFGGPGKPIELYDLKADVAEKNNVSPQQPELTAKAEAILNGARTPAATWPIKTGSK